VLFSPFRVKNSASAIETKQPHLWGCYPDKGDWTVKTSNKISSLKAGVAPVVLGFALLATPAFAQAADDEKASDEIVVTGTLIANPNVTSTSPVAVIGQDEIALRQVGNAEQIIRDLPGAVPSIGQNVNNGNGGASFVNLRGLGTNRNIVLLDGARVVPSGTGGAVDLNNIPLALIQRVDALTGGASTTYGADAVSGVLNFITRKDFSGMELQVGEGLTEKGDGNTFRADLTLGANFDDGRGNAVLSLGYQEADPIYQGDRDISLFGISSRTGVASGESFTSVPAAFSFDDDYQINAAGNALVPFYNGFNFNPYNIFVTPYQRFNMFGHAACSRRTRSAPSSHHRVCSVKP
jgi:outer membrane receptor protein involved in Fe transport